MNRPIDPCSHLVAKGKGILTTFFYGSEKDSWENTDYWHSNVFLIEILNR